MYKKVVLTALCALSLGLSAPVSTEAGGLAGVIAAGVQGAQQYKQVTKEIDMIDTVYRNEYCEKIKGEVGVNYEWQANQQLNNIFARLYECGLIGYCHIGDAKKAEGYFKIRCIKGVRLLHR